MEPVSLITPSKYLSINIPLNLNNRSKLTIPKNMAVCTFCHNACEHRKWTTEYNCITKRKCKFGALIFVEF
jgi:hypothetical protein